MKVSPVQKNNHANFKGINIIQIPKVSFNVNNLEVVERKFKHAIRQSISRRDGFFAAISNSISSKKALIFLENPGFAPEIEELKKFGNYSMSWFRQNTGIPIKDSLNPDYHSFFVLTKKEKDEVNRLYSAKNVVRITSRVLEESKQRFPGKLFNSKIASLWRVARGNQIIDALVSPVLKGKPVEKFVLDDLSQLPKILDEIDY